MELIATPIEGLFVIKHRVYEDERGFFLESYNKSEFEKAGIAIEFVQDNISRSNSGVVRGLHFQNTPFAQGKLVRVLTGAVLDIAVDIRAKSPTYGKYFSVELTEENKLSFWVPQGFAHGFKTLRDNTLFSYKCTNFYNKDAEETLLWNDPDLAIDWNIKNPILSQKDKIGKAFCNFKSKF